MTTTTRTRAMRVFALAPAALVLLAACAAPKATPSVAPPSAVTTAAPSVAASAAGSQPASSAAAGGVTLATATGPLGTYLTGKNGLTLYYFTKDTAADATVCTDPECKGTWPPATVPAGATPAAPSGATGTFTTFVRSDDGTTQLSYDGHPLYYFAGDTQPGDMNGQGIGNVWFVADVTGAIPSTAVGSAAPASAAASAAPSTSSGGYNY